jgi:hypothetical protein
MHDAKSKAGSSVIGRTAKSRKTAAKPRPTNTRESLSSGSQLLHPLVLEKSRFQEIVNELNFVCQVFRQDNLDEFTTVANIYRERLKEFQDILAELRKEKELQDTAVADVYSGYINPDLTRAFIDKLLRVAILEVGLASNARSGTQKMPEEGYLSAPEPPQQEAPVQTSPSQIAKETILLLQSSETRRRGRPPKSERGTARAGLRPFVIKLSKQELQQLERMRRRTGVATAAEAMRAALRTFELIVDALLRGQEVVLQDPKNPQRREYLKIGGA